MYDMDWKTEEAIRNHAKALVAILNKKRYAGEGDFARNPAGCERFRELFKSHPKMRGERGRPSYTALAELLHVDERTAKKRVENPATLTQGECALLKNALGSQTYEDMVHGSGYYEREMEIKEREELIGEIAQMLRHQPLEMVMGVRDRLRRSIEEARGSALP